MHNLHKSRTSCTNYPTTALCSAAAHMPVLALLRDMAKVCASLTINHKLTASIHLEVNQALALVQFHNCASTVLVFEASCTAELSRTPMEGEFDSADRHCVALLVTQGRLFSSFNRTEQQSPVGQ